MARFGAQMSGCGAVSQPAMLAAASASYMVGRTVGHYRIVRKIGEGGVGHVYLAEDVTLERQVALKVLAESSPVAEQAARFEREAKAAAALDHPNILAIHEFSRDG